MQGSSFIYRGAVMSSSSSSQNTWEESINIISYDQSILTFSRSVSNKTQYVVGYDNGFPTHVDYLPNLIYLPPESIAQALNGNLDWIARFEILKSAASINQWTAQRLNYTVEAGTFQAVNITLAVVGMDYGQLTFIYDTESGILIYEQWIPQPYGDIIIYALINASIAPTTLSYINALLPISALSIPLFALIHQSYTRIASRFRHEKDSKTRTLLKDGFPRKPYYVMLVAAALSVVSIFAPWSQYGTIKAYLPLSLPLTFSEYLLLPTNGDYLIMSILAHAAVLVAWLGVVLHLYVRKKVLPEILTLVSSGLGLSSAFIFFQTKLSSFLGLQIMIIAMVLAVVGIILAQIKIEIKMEKEIGAEDIKNTETPPEEKSL